MRRPWVAATLSVVTPGLGQLYNGRAPKAALLLIGVPIALLALSASSLVLPLPPLNVVLPLVTALGLIVGAAIDAARDARRLHGEPRPWYGRWYSCATVWVLSAFVYIPALRSTFVTYGLQGFSIPSGGMEPTVLIGDRLFVDKSAYGIRLPLLGSGSRSRPERAALVAFLFPEDRSRVFLKRVIGLPGEKVEVRGRTVYVNDLPLHEPYGLSFARLPEEDGGRRNWGPATVPAGHVFVLGDNRDNNRDSRFWGFVPTSDIVGLARIVYFSWDPSARRVRWERIGHRLR